MTAIATLRANRSRTRRRKQLPSWAVLFCYAFFGLIVFLALAGDLVSPQSAGEQNLGLGLTGPNPAAWFGTDELGRDILSRSIAGARIALIGPLVIAVGAMSIGTVLGLLAGYWGGWVDNLIMRWVDLMSAVPALLIAIVAVGALGGGYWMGVVVLIILGSPGDTRIVRASALSQRHLPYVEAAHSLGLSPLRVMVRHIYPNLLPVIVANTFLHFSFSLVNLSALAFLGIGAQPGTPDWGMMLSDSRRLIFENPAAAIVPALLLALTSMSANIIGDDVFERLSGRGKAK